MPAPGPEGPQPCPGGGIGRRAGFRYLWPQGRGSSSLLLGTTISEGDPRPAGRPVSVTLHRGDLPGDIAWGGTVAIDTETMGLNPHRDRLCLVQLSAGDGTCHAVQIPAPPPGLGPRPQDAPNLRRLLADPAV